MNYIGYSHWALVVILGAIWLLKNWQGENVARKPLIAGIGLVCTGIVIALSEGDFETTGFLDFMLFVNVNFASTTIAIGYSFFAFWLVSSVVAITNKQQKMSDDN